MPTEEAIPELDVWRYVRMFGRRKWWIIGFTIVGLIAGAGYGITAQKKYTANALLQVVLPHSTTTGPTPTIAPSDVSTQLQLLTSSAVQAVVAKSLHFHPVIIASQVGTTDVLTVAVTNASPAQAAFIANTYANDFVTYERQTSVKNFDGRRG